MPTTTVKQLLKNLTSILHEMDAHRRQHENWIKLVHPNHLHGANNLLDYLAFRSRDRTKIQNILNRWGLSSLGRSEAAIRQQIIQVSNILDGLGGDSDAIDRMYKLDAATEGRARVSINTNNLFGPNLHKRSSRIMVTLPATAGQDRELVARLLKAGMDIARINCAHDNEATWRAMASNVRSVARELGVACLIACDLAGPKLRTGAMPAGPRVLKVRPVKSLRGQILRPAKVCLYPERKEPPSLPVDQYVPLACDSLLQIKRVESIEITDARNKKRTAKVLSRGKEHIVVALEATTYFETGQQLIFRTGDAEIKLMISQLPECENYLTLALGDELKIVSDGRVATPAVKDENGQLIQPATLSCATDEVLNSVDVGHTIKLDDGKFSARAIAKMEGGLIAKIERCPPGTAKLRAEKGVNFPDTELPLAGFTRQDRHDLKCAVEIADMVNLSFVNIGADVEKLLVALEEEKASRVGVILKIETRRGFDNLPELLLTAMRWPSTGIMIARGDLGVEAGWQSVAQLQEEILWLSTAANIPCVWATQVLESMAKNGTPTRAEITDAAMAQRAECVMLNKGPFVHEAIEMLNSIIKTMDLQQEKKSALLPQIKITPLKG